MHAGTVQQAARFANGRWGDIAAGSGGKWPFRRSPGAAGAAVGRSEDRGRLG